MHLTEFSLFLNLIQVASYYMKTCRVHIQKSSGTCFFTVLMRFLHIDDYSCSAFTDMPIIILFCIIHCHLSTQITFHGNLDCFHFSAITKNCLYEQHCFKYPLILCAKITSGEFYLVVPWWVQDVKVSLYPILVLYPFYLSTPIGFQICTPYTVYQSSQHFISWLILGIDTPLIFLIFYWVFNGISL